MDNKSRRLLKLLHLMPIDFRRRLAQALSGAPAGGAVSRAAPEYARPSAFPWVSGDGFRILADVVVERGGIQRRPSAENSDRPIVFAEVGEVESPAGVERVLHAIEECGGRDEQPALILHNGDGVVDEERLKQFGGLCRAVYAVNTMDGPNAVPIPIGLENAHHRKNGVVEDFLSVNPNDRVRDITVLACFSVGTNRRVRDPLRSAVLESHHGFVEPDLDPVSHRSLLQRSLFVLSPPGNGPDCHRTWEAIVLGAVPVVLRDSLAQSLVDEAPIHAVDRYDDFLELDFRDLQELYREVISRRPSSALLASWIVRLLG